MSAGFRGVCARLSQSDVAAGAKRLGVETAMVAAFLDVESSGSGYDSAGRPKIEFEPHIFYRQLAGKKAVLAAAVAKGLAYPVQGTKPYPTTSAGAYAVLEAACALDHDAALASASWGIGQVMGENYAALGYASVCALVLACMNSEAAQLGMILSFLQSNHLVAAMKVRDFTTLARGYNGPKNVAEYSAKLAAAYAHHAVPAPAKKPSSAPPAFDRAATTADSLNDAEFLSIRSGVSAGTKLGIAGQATNQGSGS